MSGGENNNEAPLKVLSASEIRKQNAPFIRQLPSGIVVKLKKPKPFELVMKDVFRFSVLTEMEEIGGKLKASGMDKKNINSKSLPEELKKLDIADEKFRKLFELFSRYSTIAVIEPKVMTREEAESKGISENDYIEPDEFDFPDLMDIWSSTIGSSIEGVNKEKNQLPFRESEGEPVVAGLNGKEIPSETEPVVKY